ncbi:hypothetical protein CAPTEDRAFT_212303 [Capitella teleta]|uniref:Uncharacterized protein n=1 Tax=Capitella teleta TaxID=283909 RepID=R7UWD5_CAPTE|nr:hypothetical protein CAPTEDRAFT_212303 [Capitella teleta]|eukprot:ELU10933.1 hypothetical protein CAPTEDRAFT_212303 [Capitella teleta]
MIKLLQKRGTAIPTFVSDSGNLSAMLPVTFDSMNVVSLLRRIQSTQEEVSTMKALMASQSETMGCVTKLTQDLSGRVGNIEAIYVRSEDSPMQDNATEVMQSNEELKTAEDATAMKQVALDPLPATYTQVLKRRPRKKKVVPALVDDETWLTKQDLGGLSDLHPGYVGVGEATTDLNSGLLRGCVAGGVAIMWRSCHSHLISEVRLGVDWAIGIEYRSADHHFYIINIYAPYECRDNEPLYLEKMACLSAFIDNLDSTIIHDSQEKVRQAASATWDREITRLGCGESNTKKTVYNSLLELMIVSAQSGFNSWGFNNSMHRYLQKQSIHPQPVLMK